MCFIAIICDRCIKKHTRNKLRASVAFLKLLSKVSTLHCKAFQAKYVLHIIHLPAMLSLPTDSSPRARVLHRAFKLETVAVPPHKIRRYQRHSFTDCMAKVWLIDLSSNMRNFVTFSDATQQMKNTHTQPHFTRSANLSGGPHIKAVF